MQTLSELTDEEKRIEVLRWFGVLPAALLGGFAAYVVPALFIISVLGKTTQTPDAYIFDSFLLVVIPNMALGAATVIVGAKTAPRYRRTTAIVLAVLWAVLYCGRVFAFFPHGFNEFWGFQADVVGAIGAVGGFFYIHADEQEADHFKDARYHQ